MAGVLANVFAIVVDCTDPHTLAAFWRSLLGGDLVSYPELGVVALRAPGVTFDFARTEDQKRTKNRWHLDLASDDPGGAWRVLSSWAHLARTTCASRSTSRSPATSRR